MNSGELYVVRQANKMFDSYHFAFIFIQICVLNKNKAQGGIAQW